MLKMIDETLDEAISTLHKPITNDDININKLLEIMEKNNVLLLLLFRFSIQHTLLHLRIIQDIPMILK